jgi:peptide/nickel transport system permease protein
MYAQFFILRSLSVLCIMKWLIKRLLYSLCIMALVVSLVLSIIYLAPVDPARLTFGQRADNKTIAARRQQLGLDKPLPVQLLMYLRDLSPIDCIKPNEERSALTLFTLADQSRWVVKWPHLRYSYQSGLPVGEILTKALPQTGILALSALFIALLLGIPLGVLSALRAGTRTDWLLQGISVLGYSAPSYIVAILVALLFAYYWGDWTGLPVQASFYQLSDYGELQINWRAVVLPAFALGIRPVGLILQLTRSSLLDTLKLDYVRTATAKGLSRRKVIWHHALRNALNPVVTAAGGWLAGLLAGAFFIEYVFAYNGLGMVTVQALLQFDIPVLVGSVLCSSAIFQVINILTDWLYTRLDPRVQLE